MVAPVNKYFDLPKTIQVLSCGAFLSFVVWAMPKVDRWHGGAGVALYFMALFVGLLLIGLVVAPTKPKSKKDYANLIDQYAKCLAQSHAPIIDIDILQAPKNEIGEALLLALVGATVESEVERSLRYAFVELAKFQPLTPRQKRAVRIIFATPESQTARVMQNPKIASEVLAEVLPLYEVEARERETREKRLSELDASMKSRNEA